MKVAKLQELLVKAAENGSPQDFAGFLTQHVGLDFPVGPNLNTQIPMRGVTCSYASTQSGRDAELDVKEVLQTLPAKLLHRLCQGLSHQVRHNCYTLNAQ